jgi:hypothetical protein
MHTAAIAVVLRERGIDAIAVTEVAGLRGTADAELFTWAAAPGRSIVTENVRDFIPLAQRMAGDGHDHAGLILTNPRRFPRSTVAYPGGLIEALTGLASSGWPDGPSQTWWL